MPPTFKNKNTSDMTCFDNNGLFSRGNSRASLKFVLMMIKHLFVGGIPERVRNLPSMLTADENGKTADRLFYDLVRASQLGNIILVRNLFFLSFIFAPQLIYVTERSRSC